MTNDVVEGGCTSMPIGPVRATRAVEYVATWPEASARLREIREAGYRGTATDMGDEGIVIHISAGKHRDLSRLPGGNK